MTEMLQKTENVAKNVANENSQDLTEQWKKGELPSGYYYVKNEFGNIFPSDYSEDYDCINDTVIKDFFTEVSEIKQVLAPVPSYDEWFKIKNLASLSECLQEKNIECLHRENKLKELLKDCRLAVFDYPPFDLASDKIRLTNKIDEVLK